MSSSSNDEQADLISDPGDELTKDTEICLKNYTKPCELSASTVISGDLLSALDRTNINIRKTVYLLAAAAQTYGHPGAPNAAKLLLFLSSIPRSSDGPLVIHFDGKFLSAISGASTKEDSVAVLVSGREVDNF